MVDNIDVTPGTGKTIAADLITIDGAAALVQRVKPVFGAPGSGADADIGSGTGGSATQRVIIDSAQLAGNVTSQGAYAAGAQQVSLPSDHPAVPVKGSGTAGTANAGVVTVQGIASMTPVLATATLSAETTKVIGTVNVAAAQSIGISPSTTDVAVTPTVTASAYTANNCIGGIMTFASILAATSFNGILQSITAKFKGTVVTSTINVHIFKASPSNGTYTDKTAVTWNAADMANLLGTYQLTSPLSTLGTMTSYNLDGIGKSLVGASQSLFVVATITGTPTPASTSDFTLELSVLPG